MAQQNRIILISGMISVLLGFVAGFLGGRLATPPVAEKPTASVIRAESFQLTDANGITRGRFEVDSRGMARMVLGGQDGVIPGKLGHRPPRGREFANERRETSERDGA